MKRVFSALLLFSALLVPVFASGQKEAADNDESSAAVKVFVSIVPQTYFVEKIGGDRVKVDVMVPPGKDPESYEPTPSQVTALGAADVFFTVGVPFEKGFLPKIKDSLPDLTIVDTGKGITRRQIEPHYDDGEDELESGPDPHIWMSPALVKVQAQNIYDALVAIDPEGKDVYAAGLKTLDAELDSVDAKIADELAPYKGKTFFIFHPAMGYFADEFGLKQVPIQSGGKDPSAEKLSSIIQEAKDAGVKVIFVQPEFSQQAAGVIADAIGGNVVKLNPLNPDYINNITVIADKIKASYEE